MYTFLKDNLLHTCYLYWI